MWKEPFSFRRLFDDLDREFATAEVMLNRMFRTVGEGDIQPLKDNFPYYYGYQITVGSNGRPQVKEFGNVRPTMKGLVEQSGIRNPLVDTNFNDKENTYIITAEMPGVTKEDIKVSISEQTVTIRAEHGDKKYLSEIPFNIELDDMLAKAAYTNGILELKIKAKEQPKPKAKEIKVE
ncbi:MAG TPA: archaeal heat shock protein Hsp20 [Nitrososphaeraceae archaeon]|nr:archaeal heat shock protein Hsp20 [Nitrososphaeraceae archaeon]